MIIVWGCPQRCVVHEINRALGSVALQFRSIIQKNGAAYTVGNNATQLAGLCRTLRSKRVMFYAKCELVVVKSARG